MKFLKRKVFVIEENYVLKIYAYTYVRYEDENGTIEENQLNDPLKILVYEPGDFERLENDIKGLDLEELILRTAREIWTDDIVREYKEYLASNENHTPEEYQAFLNSLAGKVSNKGASKQKKGTKGSLV